MPRLRDYRYDFSAGVVPEEFLAHPGDLLTSTALRTGTNAFLDNAGNVRRRPGTNRRTDLPGTGREHIFELRDGSLRHFIFRSGELRIYGRNGSFEDSVSGPWGADDLFTMTLVKSPEPQSATLFVFSQSFFPQKISLGDSGWSIENYAFREQSSGRRASLFSRFTDDPITVTLGAYSGTGVSVTFSDDVLQAGHVGVMFMYMGNQFEITAVTNGTTGTATIVDRLFPSVRVAVANTDAYLVGDIVSGDVTAVRGQVVAIGSGTIDVALMEGYTLFQPETVDGDVTIPGEKLNGPNGAEEISTVATLSTPLATNIWLEEVISAVRGYPGTGASHNQRLFIAGFPKLGNAIAASSIGAFDDFDLGGGSDTDAIFEFIGEDSDAQIKHLASLGDLFMLTETWVWHVPTRQDRIIAPTSISFERISPDPASDVLPVLTPEGVFFIDAIGRGLLLPAGENAGAPPAELTHLGYQLLNEPKQLAYASGIGGRPERAAIVVNGDGTLAVFCHRRGGEQAGWVPWQRRSTDTFDSVATFNQDVFCVATADGTARIEEFDFDAILDAQADEDDGGTAAEDVHILKSDQVLGTVTLDGSGNVPALGDLTIDAIGHDFALTVEPAPYINANAGRQRRRVAKCYADMVETGTFRLNGALCQHYDGVSDLEAPPPAVTREWRKSQLGSSTTRTVILEQRDGEGAPFRLRSLTMEVMVS